MIIGLTGNYGMGKSSVLAEFRRLGAATLDSDRVVAGLLKERGVISKVRRLLGPEVVAPSGRLLKKKVAERVFASPELRRGLEDIIHPLVMKRVEAFAKTMKRGIAVVEVPLLFEGGYEGRFDRTITVYTTVSAARARLAAAGVSGKDAEARLKAQMPISRKKRLSDYRIDNGGTPDRMRSRVGRIFRELAGECAYCP